MECVNSTKELFIKFLDDNEALFNYKSATSWDLSFLDKVPAEIFIVGFVIPANNAYADYWYKLDNKWRKMCNNSVVTKVSPGILANVANNWLNKKGLLISYLKDCGTIDSTKPNSAYGIINDNNDCKTLSKRDRWNQFALSFASEYWMIKSN